ncbi:MAG: hypothetical protein WA902_07070 [Thermosynechococcaceae cyanobacterium]
MYYRNYLLAGVTVAGLLLCTSGKVLAQAATTNIDAPNNSTSTANPNVTTNQQGSLVNTQVNNYSLGRGVVGNGVADCSSSGLALSAYGNGIGPFDSGSLGGSLTYTQSFGMDTCKNYAKNQLAKSKLETCLLLISNYSKMTKAGIKVSYEELKTLAGVDCPAVSVPRSESGPFGAAPNPGNVNARNSQAAPSAYRQQDAPVAERPALSAPQQVRVTPQPQPAQQQRNSQPVQQRPATAQYPSNQRIQAWQ